MNYLISPVTFFFWPKQLIKFCWHRNVGCLLVLLSVSEWTKKIKSWTLKLPWGLSSDSMSHQLHESYITTLKSSFLSFPSLPSPPLHFPPLSFPSSFLPSFSSLLSFPPFLFFFLPLSLPSFLPLSLSFPVCLAIYLSIIYHLFIENYLHQRIITIWEALWTVPGT